MQYYPVLQDVNFKSLKEFLNNNLIELLPNQDIIIANHLNLIKYLDNNPSMYILRKFKNHNKRGKIYSFQDLSFTVSDNEPALWVFMESFNNSKLDFIDIIQNQKLPIAFALKSDERSENEWANVGRKHSEFSANGWKHCHILQCAPYRSKIEKRDDLQKRCLRLLSPINHFPFLSPKRCRMPYDYGEDIKCIELVIWWLYNNFYNDKNKEIFKGFIESQSFKVPAEEPDDVLLNIEHRTIKSNNTIKSEIKSNFMLQNNSTFIKRGIKCETKNELIHLLKMWLKTDEGTIGDINNYIPKTPWIYLNLDNLNYSINADTRRQGVEVFIKNNQSDYPWRIIQNENGVFNKITNDKGGQLIPFFYFYIISKSEIEHKSYFQIAQQWYGQKKVIRVCFRLEIYEYDHDYVYDRTIGHLKTLACWDNYGRYSSTNNIPRWAKAFVKQVK